MMDKQTIPDELMPGKQMLDDEMLDAVTGDSNLWKNIKKTCDEIADWVKSKF